MTPSSRDVRIGSASGKPVDGLGVREIQYDSSSTDWLPRPRWRDGNGSAPATLILEPQVGEIPPGTYTAHVPIVSSSHAGVATSITATLVVKATTPAIVKGTEPDKCVGAQARLARVRTMTDPQTGTAADARRVVSLVPALLADLCTERDRVEARLRLAEAHMTLSESARACDVLRALGATAASTSFAENVRVYLSHCP
jgi:hypothetical protein